MKTAISSPNEAKSPDYLVFLPFISSLAKRLHFSLAHRATSFHQNKEKGANGSFLFVLVEMMGIEPMSENPLIGLSSQAVCYLAFPLGSESRHPHPQSSPFVPDRFKGERPVQVHHCDDAQSGVVVLSGGTGGPQATALLSQPLTGQNSGSQSNSVVVV